MEVKICAICLGELNQLTQATVLGRHFRCKSCGDYAITFHLLDNNEQLAIDANDRVRLSHVMFEHRLMEGTQIIISSGSGHVDPSMPAMTPAELLARYPRNPSDFYDRALENLARLVNHPAATVPLEPYQLVALFSEPQNSGAMLTDLSELGYLVIGINKSYRITPQGWQRLSQLRQAGKNSKQAFIAMWFNKNHLKRHEAKIREAIEADGKTRAVIINRVEHNEKIDDLIISEIRKSRYLVADFTKHRQGVYFEAGFAMGLGIPVVWCLKEGDVQPHFDTRQYNHIMYTSPQDLCDKLRLRISALNL